jgi:hypothetical protein
MSSSEPVTSSPEELVFTFKQGDEESFKDAWSRIFSSYRKTEPQMTLSLLLSNFYFGLMVRYRYALDTLVGGDFLHCNGDQAFNAIKKLVASHDSANNFDSVLTSIYSRLNNLEISTSRLNDNYCHVRNRLEQVLVNSKLSLWDPAVKIVIGDRTLHAYCDIMYEFCLMPESIYKSLKLWGVEEGGEEITLIDNSTITPKGIAAGVHTTIRGRTISIDYLVVETGKLTLGRSLLKLLGAVIDVGEGTLKFTSIPGETHIFPKPKGKKNNKKGKGKAQGKVDAPSLDNT